MGFSKVICLLDTNCPRFDDGDSIRAWAAMRLPAEVGKNDRVIACTAAPRKPGRLEACLSMIEVLQVFGGSGRLDKEAGWGEMLLGPCSDDQGKTI